MKGSFIVIIQGAVFDENCRIAFQDLFLYQGVFFAGAFAATDAHVAGTNAQAGKAQGAVNLSVIFPRTFSFLPAQWRRIFPALI